MYRNEVYNKDSQRLNHKFLEYNHPVIAKVTGWEAEAVDITQSMLLEISGILNAADHAIELEPMFDAIKDSYPEDIAELGKQIINKLSHQEVFGRAKSFRSLDLTRAMYS